jgi:hypothetical protein
MDIDAMEKELKLIRESQIRMEADIHYHIKRTDIIEDRTEKLWKSYIGIQWTIAAVAVAAAILMNLEKIRSFLG